jgi:alanyl-tRNA synthetase
MSNSTDTFVTFLDMGVGQLKKVLESLRSSEQKLEDIAAVLRCEPDQIISRLVKLMDERNELRDEVERLKVQAAEKSL